MADTVIKTKLIRTPEVLGRAGFSNSLLYELMAQGLFPRSVKIGPRAVAWVESEVDDHIASCIADRDSNGRVA